jgi:hypothetical protein
VFRFRCQRQGSTISNRPVCQRSSRRAAWIGSRDFSYEAVQTMEACFRQKHERALSRHHTDSALSTELDRFCAYGAFARGPIHPDPSYGSFSAVAHHGLCRRRRCHQKCRIHGRLNFLHASKATMSLNLRRAGIHRHYVIAALAQLLEQGSAKLRSTSRNADHGDALLRQEIFDDFKR